MLDEKGYIERFDTDDALSVAAHQPAQLLETLEVKLPEIKNIEAIVVAGIGGSALAADLARNYLDLGLPFEIVRGYELPGYVNQRKTLLICASYSGNTEETLACFEQALASGNPLIVLASGGKLAELARAHELPLLLLPSGYQPRLAVWFGLKILAAAFDKLGLSRGQTAALETAAPFLTDAAKSWLPAVPTTENQAKRIAEELMGKAVWIYSGPALSSAAYKWKIDLNENAKNVASCNVLPEFNHNEFIGWTSHPVEKPFAVVQLRSSLDHPQVQKRFDLTNRLLSGRMPRALEIAAEGKTQLEQLLWSCLLGDFVSIYLGILNGVNPSRVEAIERLKREL